MKVAVVLYSTGTFHASKTKKNGDEHQIPDKRTEADERTGARHNDFENFHMTCGRYADHCNMRESFYGNSKVTELATMGRRYECVVGTANEGLVTVEALARFINHAPMHNLWLKVFRCLSDFCRFNIQTARKLGPCKTITPRKSNGHRLSLHRSEQSRTVTFVSISGLSSSRLHIQTQSSRVRSNRNNSQRLF
ncbi:hypothetical protein CBL_01568 [Carabus blaptoides fortunei]